MKKKQSLKLRLWANAGLLLSLLFVIGLSSVLALKDNLSNFEMVESENAVLAEINRASEDILNMRLNVNSYLRTNNDKYAVVSADFGNSARKGVSEIMDNEKDSEHSVLEQKTVKLLDVYLEALETSRAYAADYVDGASIMRATGSKVLSGVDKIVDSAYATTDMAYQKQATSVRFDLLEGRLAAVKFREKSSKEAADKAVKALSDFQSSFAKLTAQARSHGENAAVAEVEANAGAYLSAFEKVAESRLANTALVADVMAPLGVEMLGYITQIRTESAESFAKVIDGAIQRNNVIMGVISTVILVAIVLGLVLASALATSIVKSIQSIIEDLTHTSTQVGGAANEISASSQSLAEASSEQAATVEETSASMEEISSMVKANANAVEMVRDRSNDANKAAQEGNERMKELERKLSSIRDAGNALKEAMGQISKSSKEVAQVAATIDEIAFQTNLLSLNAAVEAARAGEAGAGFAVVAGEVGQLAQRSAQNATQTTQLIAQSEDSSKAGVSASDEVLKSLDAATLLFEEVIKAFDSITTQVSDVSVHSDEVRQSSVQQTQGIEQINTAISQLDQVIQQNAATSEETAGAAAQLTTQSDQLRRVVEQLREVVYGTDSISDFKPGSSAPSTLKMFPGEGGSSTISASGARPKNAPRSSFTPAPERERHN